MLKITIFVKKSWDTFYKILCLIETHFWAIECVHAELKVFYVTKDKKNILNSSVYISI